MHTISVRPAHYFTYEPGDGTRYTVLTTMTSTKNTMYLAIGAGDVVEFGYHVPFNNLLYDLEKVADLIRSADDEERQHMSNRIFVQMPIVGYWLSHMTHIENRASQQWTATVGLLMTAVVGRGTLTSELHYNLPGYIYRGEWDKVLLALEDLLLPR